MGARNWHTLVSNIMHPVSLIKCDMVWHAGPPKPCFDNLAASTQLCSIGFSSMVFTFGPCTEINHLDQLQSRTECLKKVYKVNQA